MAKGSNWMYEDISWSNLLGFALRNVYTMRMLRDNQVAEGAWPQSKLDELKAIYHEAIDIGSTSEFIHRHPEVEPWLVDGMQWLKYPQVLEPTEMSEYWMYADPDNDRLMLVHRPWTAGTGIPKMADDGSIQLTKELYDEYINKVKPFVKTHHDGKELEKAMQEFDARLHGSVSGSAHDVIRPEEEVTPAFEYTVERHADEQKS